MKYFDNIPPVQSTKVSSLQEISQNRAWPRTLSQLVTQVFSKFRTERDEGTRF